MDETETDARLAELAVTERALWNRVEGGDSDATEECAALLNERDSLLNPVTGPVAALDGEERERTRRNLLLGYTRIEAVLLAQEQTPDVTRQLAETRRLRDNLDPVQMADQGLPAQWRQDMLAEIDQLDQKALAGAAAGFNCVTLLSKIELLRLEVLAARGGDEGPDSPALDPD